MDNAVKLKLDENFKKYVTEKKFIEDGDIIAHDGFPPFYIYLKGIFYHWAFEINKNDCDNMEVDNTDDYFYPCLYRFVYMGNIKDNCLKEVYGYDKEDKKYKEIFLKDKKTIVKRFINNLK